MADASLAELLSDVASVEVALSAEDTPVSDSVVETLTPVESGTVVEAEAAELTTELDDSRLTVVPVVSGIEVDTTDPAVGDTLELSTEETSLVLVTDDAAEDASLVAVDTTEDASLVVDGLSLFNGADVVALAVVAGATVAVSDESDALYDDTTELSDADTALAADDTDADIEDATEACEALTEESTEASDAETDDSKED